MVYEYRMTRLVPILVTLGQTARSVAISLLAALWPGQDDASVAARLEALPGRAQAAVIAMVLALMFVGALIAGLAGWIGILVYWAIVILLIR